MVLLSTKLYIWECHWSTFFPGVDSLVMLGNTGSFMESSPYPWEREEDLPIEHIF